MALLAVLDLAELIPYETDVTLPHSGLLNFFFEADEQQAFGLDPSHRDGWRVILTDPTEAVETPAPADTPEFASIGLQPSQTLTLPGWEEPAVASIFPPRHQTDDLAEQARNAFLDVTDAWDDLMDTESTPNHQVGGWPRLQQAPIWEECDTASQGLSLEHTDRHTDPRLAQRPNSEKQWQLLFQLDTDEDAGWMWGDVGTLFYAIRHPLEPPRIFEEAWMVLQCG